MEKEEKPAREFITALEAARRIGVSQRAIRDAIGAEKLLGGLYRGRYIVAVDSLADYAPRAYPRKGELTEVTK